MFSFISGPSLRWQRNGNFWEGFPLSFTWWGASAGANQLFLCLGLQRTMTRLGSGRGEILSLLVSWGPRWGGDRNALQLWGYFQAHPSWGDTMAWEYGPKQHHRTKLLKWWCINPAVRSNCLLEPAQTFPHPAPICCDCSAFLLPGREGRLISFPHIQKSVFEQRLGKIHIQKHHFVINHKN